ncbi:hypothetical protein Bca52824_088004 [Brassica carinata]|uniref:Uncharacterized protein n=1 Tax=Brassica carinata TaxID=52824 RepID=A0A8X7TQE2_BRACI|nr:hypothetical protein Bca52824_088004 [Brassica carinata]
MDLLSIVSSRPLSLRIEGERVILVFGLHMGLHSYSQPSQDETFGGAESDSDYNEVESLIQQDQAQLDQALIQRNQGVCVSSAAGG